MRRTSILRKKSFQYLCTLTGPLFYEYFTVYELSLCTRLCYIYAMGVLAVMLVAVAMTATANIRTLTPETDAFINDQPRPPRQQSAFIHQRNRFRAISDSPSSSIQHGRAGTLSPPHRGYNYLIIRISHDAAIPRPSHCFKPQRWGGQTVNPRDPGPLVI